MEFLNRQVDSNASIYNDLHSLDRIRQQAKTDNRSAIKAAAKEFEAFFMNMMLKSMRQASEVIGDDSMFGSQQEKMFVGMLDEQLSVDLSQKGNLGIAELLTRDLLGENTTLDSNTLIANRLGKTHFAASTNNSVQLTSNRFDGESLTTNSDNNDKDTDSNLAFVKNSANQSAVIDLKQLNYLDKLSKVNVVSSGGEDSQVDPLTKINTESIAHKKSLFSSAESFISQLLPTAKKVSQSLGVDPKLLLAQAALETGWGKYIMHNSEGEPSYNLFGIKGGNDWQGDSINANTLEVEQGTFVKRQAKFRMYESFEQSFQDYVEFVKSSPRYQHAVEVVDSAKAYIQSLQESGYATDPNYAEKIINIYENGIKPSSVLK